MTSESFDALMKIVIIGDSAVGKTCLILRYSQDVFRPNFLSTIGKSTLALLASMSSIYLFTVMPIVQWSSTMNELACIFVVESL